MGDRIELDHRPADIIDEPRGLAREQRRAQGRCIGMTRYLRRKAGEIGTDLRPQGAACPAPDNAQGLRVEAESPHPVAHIAHGESQALKKCPRQMRSSMRWRQAIKGAACRSD